MAGKDLANTKRNFFEYQVWRRRKKEGIYLHPIPASKKSKIGMAANGFFGEVERLDNKYPSSFQLRLNLSRFFSTQKVIIPQK